MYQISQALLFLMQLLIYIYFHGISSVVIWLWLSWIYEIHVHHRRILRKLYALLFIFATFYFSSALFLILIKFSNAFLLFRVLKRLQFLPISCMLIFWRSPILFLNSVDVGITIWKDSMTGYYMWHVLLWLIALGFRTNWKGIDLIGKVLVVSNWWMICCCFFLACVCFLDCAWSISICFIISVCLGDGVWLAFTVLGVIHGHCSRQMSFIDFYDFGVLINLLVLIIWHDVVEILRILLAGIVFMRSILESWLRATFGGDFMTGNWLIDWFLFWSDLVTGFLCMHICVCSWSLLWTLLRRWHTEVTWCKAQLFHIKALLIELWIDLFSCWRILIFRNSTIRRLSSFSVSIFDAALNIWDIHWLLLRSGCWILVLSSIGELAIRYLFKLDKVGLLFQVSLAIKVWAALSIVIIGFIRMCTLSVISAHLPSQLVHICRLVSVVFFFYRCHIILFKDWFSCFFFRYWFTFESMQWRYRWYMHVSEIQVLLVELIMF